MAKNTGSMKQFACMTLLSLMPVFPFSTEAFAQQEVIDCFPLQKVSADTAELFTCGLIPTGFSERDLTVSHDGKELYYGFSSGKVVTILYSRYENGRWSEPVVAPFADDDRFYYFEPCLNADDSKIFFLSNRPVKGKEPKAGWACQNIWVADRMPDGTWSQPYDPGPDINSGTFQFYPSLTNDNTLYFCRTDPETKHNSVFRLKNHNGKYSVCEKLPAPVNTDTTNPFNAFVSPDESFLIACISEIIYKPNPGRANYFVFFRNSDDSWSGPFPFGPEININGSGAISSSVSPDGRLLFFAAQVNKHTDNEELKPKSLNEIMKYAMSPRNGNYDIYCINATVIENLRTEAMENLKRK